MIEELERLIKLQTLDNSIGDLVEEIGDLPETVDKLNIQIKEIEKKISNREANLEEIEEAEKKNLSELRSAQSGNERTKKIIYSVKTTKEYDAISSEIDQAKKIIEECEKKDTQLIHQAEKLQIEVLELKDDLEKIHKDLAQMTSEMNERLSDTKEEIDQHRYEREKIKSSLKTPVLKHYERIREMRDGVGISCLAGNACSYCYSVLPPQRKVEVNKMEDLILCEVCGCIIVSEVYAEELQR